MKLMLTPDDMVAKVWDDYLHWFGAGAYVMARYICAPPTTPMNENASEVPLDQVESVWSDFGWPRSCAPWNEGAEA